MKPERLTGLAHFFAAAGYSLGGLRRLWRESAFRQEVLAAVLVLAALVALSAPFWAYLAVAVLICIVFAVEALNTAIEVLVDHLSPEWSSFARDAKDLGSLAVMCILIAIGIVLAAVVVQRFF